jgi:hypothetical protein
MSSTRLSVTKSVLAKLLAGENITVVHDSKIKTAMFDTTARVLYLPVWEVMDGELYDLLVGHEDGHALHTPDREWCEAIDSQKKDRTFKDCLNVVEDARIEKLIKRKYPGLARSFSIGYKQLFERDFFGVKKLKDLNTLNIIDRLNLYFKCGSFIVLPFTDEERALVRDTNDAETFAQVVDIALRVWKHAQDEENKLSNIEDLTEQLLKQFEDQLRDELGNPKDDSECVGEEKVSRVSKKDSTDGEGKEKDSKDKGKGKDEENTDKADGDATDDSSEEDGDGDGEKEDDEGGKDGGTLGGKDDGKDKKPIDKPIESVTDRTFRQRQEELVQEGVEIHTYSFPKPVLERIVVPAKVITERFFTDLNTANKQNLPMVSTCVNRFNENNKRYIAMLIKEFEMRKNAKQFARTTVARTGELDMGKLAQYKFNNDLFRKISVVQKGKNHGIIMYIDMSGSMSGVFGPTVEQMLILATFCKKVGIPFDVYGFSDDTSYVSSLINAGKLKSTFFGTKFQKMSGDKFRIDNEKQFHLKHLIGSSFTPMQYRASFEMLAVVAMNYRNVRYPRIALGWHSNGFALSGTPFVQTVMASRPMIEDFQRRNQVEVCNVIYLTDGEGCPAFKFDDITSTYENGKKIAHKVYFIDQKTKQKVEVSHSVASNQQRKITQFVRTLTGCKHIGFYLTSGGDINAKIEARSSHLTPAESQSLKKFYEANDYASFPHIGYDIYYYMHSRNKNVEDKDYDLKTGDNTIKITAKFSDAQLSKKRNRALVASLAKEFAE